MKLNQTCRLCLSESAILIDIFTYSSNLELAIADAMTKCAPVHVTKSDKLPKCICDECLIQLENVYRFQLKAVKSEETLYQYLNINQSTLIKQENSSDGYEQDTETVFIKEEKVEIPEYQPFVQLEALNETEIDLLRTGKNKETVVERKNTTAVSSVSEKTLYRCEICEKCFTRKNYLQKHKIVHTDKKPYRCEVCNKTFKFASNYLTHKKNHSATPTNRSTPASNEYFDCEVCSRKFSTTHKLQMHQAIHTGNRPYQCEICSKCFTTMNTLRGHRHHHTTERPFLCDICSMRFKRLAHLESHRSTHLGIKPHACHLCSKSFTRSSYLKAHIKIHSDVDSLQCKLCNKKFTRALHLKSHLRGHTGEKPFECDLCHKRFKHQASIIYHKRCVHFVAVSKKNQHF